MKRILSAALGLSLITTTAAFAGEGYVIRNVNLRAGPDSSYPSVARLRAGAPIEIEGCVGSWSWCDVSNGEQRGWIAANYIQEEFEGRRVLVPEYGARIGIPIVSFQFGSYWDDHYRGRSWYDNREHWSHVRPQYGHFDSHEGHDTRHDSRYIDSHRDSHERRAEDFPADNRGPQQQHRSMGMQPAQQAPTPSEHTREQHERADRGTSPIVNPASHPVVSAQHNAAQRTVVHAPPPERESNRPAERERDKDRDQH